jgi:hypothetical protein
VWMVSTSWFFRSLQPCRSNTRRKVKCLKVCFFPALPKMYSERIRDLFTDAGMALFPLNKDAWMSWPPLVLTMDSRRILLGKADAGFLSNMVTKFPFDRFRLDELKHQTRDQIGLGFTTVIRLDHIPIHELMSLSR